MGQGSGRAARPLRPRPRSLANHKREISEKKWAEARRWAGGGTSKTKYRMPESQKPDGAMAGSTKRHASTYYQLKRGRARTGQYLHWAKVRATAQWEKLVVSVPLATRYHVGGSGVGDGHGFHLFFPFYLPWCASTFARDRPGRKAERCLHCAALRCLRRGNGLYIWATPLVMI